MQKYIAKFFTGRESKGGGYEFIPTSYMMDIFLEEKDYIGGLQREEDTTEYRLAHHAAVLNEVDRNHDIVQVKFYQEVPNAIWERKDSENASTQSQ